MALDNELITSVQIPPSQLVISVFSYVLSVITIAI